MKKWIALVVVLIIAGVVAGGIYLYQIVRVPLEESLEEVRQLVIQDEQLVEVEHVDYYHGTNAYYVATGVDEEGDEAAVWLTQELELVEQLKLSDGISADEAVSIANSDADIATLQSVKLGYERDLPVYEVKFIDDTDRQGYYYVTFSDGTFMKRYNLQRGI